MGSTGALLNLFLFWVMNPSCRLGVFIGKVASSIVSLRRLQQGVGPPRFSEAGGFLEEEAEASGFVFGVASAYGHT